MPSPEDQARENIDALLERCGWQAQDKSSVNLQRATRLCQAILQRAFEGRLVNMEAEWTSDVPHFPSRRNRLRPTDTRGNEPGSKKA